MHDLKQSVTLSKKNKALRLLWNVVWLILFRPSPRLLHSWRCFLLKCFGAKLGKKVHIYPTVRIWAPWNLKVKNNSCLGDYVNCYNVALFSMGENSTISQYSYICSASHNYEHTAMPLVISPITIGDSVWVTADVFIAPGITIHDGAVITARSSVFRDIPEWKVARGNPATPFKDRKLMDA